MMAAPFKPGNARGLLIAAPASGSGKTTLTLGLIRALKLAGHKVAAAKAGPDYIDPKFHLAAGGANCVNLDPWAMRRETLMSLSCDAVSGSDLFIVEAMMGLFDGARDGTGSSADLAEMFGLPVILVVDAKSQSHSIAALVRGFSTHRKNCEIAGIILNRVGSPAHEKMLGDALKPLNIPVVGFLPNEKSLSLPSRHLGLVQAEEHKNLEEFIGEVAHCVSRHLDLELLADLARPLKLDEGSAAANKLPPLGQRMAIACDQAFAFIYPHFLQNWRGAGAELTFFSPLENEVPAQNSDAIFLPGGYPELHAGKLSANVNFLDGLRQAADTGVLIYGECGGYMTLGEALTDEHGQDFPMAGLLPVHTSFADRKLSLGYRRLSPCVANGLWKQSLNAHEFHYASVVTGGRDQPLFEAMNAVGQTVGPMGHRSGSVMGSFAHIIDYGDG